MNKKSIFSLGVLLSTLLFGYWIISKVSHFSPTTTMILSPIVIVIVVLIIIKVVRNIF
jgi:hypothetical protein